MAEKRGQKKIHEWSSEVDLRPCGRNIQLCQRAQAISAENRNSEISLIWAILPALAIIGSVWFWDVRSNRPECFSKDPRGDPRDSGGASGRFAACWRAHLDVGARKGGLLFRARGRTARLGRFSNVEVILRRGIPRDVPTHASLIGLEIAEWRA